MSAFQKRLVADRQRIDRLDTAVDYLLVRDLNLQSALPEGAEGQRLLREAFFALIQLLQPTIFCDIGANDGSTALAVRDLAPNCSVIGFEANPRIHAKHAELMAARGVEWRNIALADTSGRLPFFAPLTLSRAYVDGQVIPANVVESEDTGKSSLLRRNEDATYDCLEVDALTLDDFFNNWQMSPSPRRFFLWVDVEGAADKVLAGADGVLRQTEAIFIESEKFEFWKDQKRSGDIVSKLVRKGFLPVARDREYGDKQFNMLFVGANVAAALGTLMFDASSPLRACLARPSLGRGESSAPSARAPARRYLSVCGWLQSEVPVLVPCFNNPTYARGMVRQLQALGFQQIVLVDNASTSPDMRLWMESLGGEATIVRLTQNLGPHNVFLDPRNFTLLPQRFCVTDPDIFFNPDLPDGFLTDLAMLIERHHVGKAGFALEISDRENMTDKLFHIAGKDWKCWNWESQFWEKPLEELAGGDRVYDAPIDTTFALYDKKHFDPADFMRAVRVAGRFTARHLPWYRNCGLPDDEAEHYRCTEKFSYYLKNDTSR